jgi:hypothetical protein
MTSARVTSLFFVTFLAVLVLLAFSSSSRLSSQPAAPPPPAKYLVKLRYEINAPRDPHVAQYDAMIEHLVSLGFEFIPPLEKHPDSDREDPAKDEVSGLLPAGKVLNVFRNRSVVSALLMPVDYKLPEAADQPVGVRLELSPGLGTARTRELAEQARVLLRTLGFREAVGYDHRGYTGRPFTRLIGTIPAGRVETLLKDLRGQPAGWFAPLIARADLPTPLRNVTPIFVTEVLPGMPPLVEPPAPTDRGTEDFDKISPDLWSLVKAKDARNVRLQVILSYAPGTTDTAWRARLMNAAPSLLIEGRLGQFVTGIASAADAARLATLPDVAVVRLARAATAVVDAPVKQPDNARALRQSGLEALHKRNFRGKGVGLAIIDTDFRGWTDMVESKQLPRGTRLVDLTRPADPNLRPAPYPGDAKKIAHGTQCAVAAALAAPEAELFLIRIDAGAPVRLQQVVQHIQGDFLSPELLARRDELILAKAELRRARQELLQEEKKLRQDFDDYSELDEEYGYLGAIYGWIFNPRVLHQQRREYQVREQQALEERGDVLRKLIDEVRSLKGIQIVANPFVWNDGYPLGGMSPLSQWFDETPYLYRSPSPKRQGLLWFQSAGNTRGQSWTGMFRDEDENGVMEFAPPESPLPKGLWTHELSFIGWQPYEGKKTAALPNATKLRISMQWREPHDPAYFARPGEEDSYRKPLAEMRLAVLRQLNPEGKEVAADTFEVIGYSYALPQRLDYAPDYGVYEQTVEFTPDKPGRYALRVQRQRPSRWAMAADPDTGNPVMEKIPGLVATGIRPAGAATLPALEKHWDFKPRFFVDVTDEAAQRVGRPVFLDYATDLGDIGVPADARTVVTVGAADLDSHLQPYSAAGPPAGLELFRKPNIFAYDSLRAGPEGTRGAFGSSLSTSFAAGLAASLLSSPMTRDQFMEHLQRESGRVLRVPEP